MSLAPGARLGVYDVIELIGAGGMGEVYRARDRTLNRDVALKILPEVFALDPNRLARFRREAQVLAALNHSNIASIYGFDGTGAVQLLVLEFVDGPTVADRIAQGPIPLDEALSMAAQIAVALEAAHQLGIVHRDLKPANIKVRPDGTVKVLDFGLAKALADDAAAEASQSPTITSPALTRMGVILGTAAYMSPEQARGKAAGKSSDIWAFGCVLYEMLTARRAFEGDEVSETLASILKSTPDFAVLPPEIPAGVRRVLRRCLEKDPNRRSRDIGDVRLDLEDAATSQTSVLVAPTSRRATVVRALGALVAVALVVLLAYVWLKPAPTPPVVRFQVIPPENAAFGSTMGMGGNIAVVSGTVSPDGTRLVFVATDRTGTPLLWVRPIDSLAPRPLPGTDGALLPFWSPDSRFVGFFTTDKLKKIDAAGGAAQILCAVPSGPKGATWGASGIILFSSGLATLSRVSSEGGTPVVLEISDQGHRGVQAVWPYFLPDGRHFLYWVRSRSDDASAVYVGSVDPGVAARRLVSSDSNAVYASPGWLLFLRDRTLLRQSFDPDRLEMTAREATPVAEGVAAVGEIGLGAFSASHNGVLSYRSGVASSTQFAWFDRNGRMLETVGPPGSYRTLALSPDDTRLAYGDAAKGDIWILDLRRQTTSRFTFANASVETAPVWSPDGTKIFYRSTQDGGGLYEKNATGTLTERRILKGLTNGPSQVSPDGKLLLYFAIPEQQSLQDVFVLPLTGDQKPKAIVESPFGEVEPQFSPNGKWLAYLSNETGRHEVYVQPFPETGKEKWKISDTGARQPMWRADGKELFFVTDDRKLYAVSVRTEPGFDFEAPRFLFDLRADVFNARNSYIPAKDGQRFVVNLLLDSGSSPINVVLNWTAGPKN